MRGVKRVIQRAPVRVLSTSGMVEAWSGTEVGELEVAAAATMATNKGRAP